METLQNELEFSLLSADKRLFRKHSQRELNEIREDVEGTFAVVDDVRPVPEPAYAETFSLREQIPRDMPIPDMM